MPELGNIHPTQKLACASCHEQIGDRQILELGERGEISCERCGAVMKLPETVVKKIKSARHIGKNLDITA